MLAAVAHGEQRHASSAGEGYLQQAGPAAGGAGAGDCAALLPAPSQYSVTFESAFQSVCAHFGGTLASPVRREKAGAAAGGGAVAGAAAAPRASAPASSAGTAPRTAAPLTAGRDKDGDDCGTTVEGERAALRALAAVGVDARWHVSHRMALAAFESLLAMDLLRFSGTPSATGSGGGGGAGLSLRARVGSGGPLRLRASGPSVSVDPSLRGAASALAATGSPTRELRGPIRGALLPSAPVCALVEPRALAESARAGILRALAPFPDLVRWVERGGDGVR